MTKKVLITTLILVTLYAQNNPSSLKKMKTSINNKLYSFDIKIQNYIFEKYQIEIFNKIRQLLLKNNVIMAYNLFTQLKPMNVAAYKDYYYFFVVLRKFKNNQRVPEIRFIKNPFLVLKFFEISLYISNDYKKVYRLIEILNYYKKYDTLHLITADDYNRLYALLFKVLGSNTMSLFYLNKIKNKTKNDIEKINLLYKTLIKIENEFLKVTQTNINTIVSENLNVYRLTIPKPILKISF